MKINYPIKYAAMPIIEQVGWSHGLHDLEREYDVVCYIVSKCYLIGDLTKYKENGQSIKEYEVVFPYQPAEFGRWQRVTPEYNLMHGYCINANKVDVIFDSYEETLKYVKTKNEKLCENTWKHLPHSSDVIEKIQTMKDAFNEKLSKYKVLEQQILFNTSDIEIGKNKKLNYVVNLKNNKGKILACNIYGILSFFKNDKFVVYSISQEQYDDLTRIISDEQFGDIKSAIINAQGLLFHEANADYIKLGIEEESGAYYIKNNRVSYDCKMDKVTRETFENIDRDALIFYTTETIDDLLSSYKEHSEIDFRELQKSVLKKLKSKDVLS